MVKLTDSGSYVCVQLYVCVCMCATMFVCDQYVREYPTATTWISLLAVLSATQTVAHLDR